MDELWGVKGGFPRGSVVKNLPAIQETQETSVQSLGQEDPQEKEMATLSSILAWEMPWTEEPDRLQSMRLQKSQTGLSIHACMYGALNKLPNLYV